jgi:hypothetical protein
MYSLALQHVSHQPLPPQQPAHQAHRGRYHISASRLASSYTHNNLTSPSFLSLKRSRKVSPSGADCAETHIASIRSNGRRYLIAPAGGVSIDGVNIKWAGRDVPDYEQGASAYPRSETGSQKRVMSVRMRTLTMSTRRQTV